MARPRRSHPDRVFLALTATTAFVSTLVFTIAPVFRFRAAGLDDLQLVLVGSAMEAAVFLFEIPTGVVADRWSRKWSVILGHAGMGVGFLLEAGAASFTGVLTGQVVWGIAYTFTSGATVAWVSGELGDPERAVLTRLFLRASRLGSLGALVAVPLSFGLAVNVSLRAPLVLGGCISLALAAWLVRAMREEHFTPAPAARRSTWRALVSTAAAGGRTIRTSHALVFLTIAIFLAGGASEAYDRYVDKHLLSVSTPTWPGWSDLTWLAIVAWVSAGLGVVVPWWFERRHPHLDETRQRHWIIGLVLAQVGAPPRVRVRRVVPARGRGQPADQPHQVAPFQPARRVDRAPHATNAPSDRAVDDGASRLDQSGDGRPDHGPHRPGCGHPGRARRERRTAGSVGPRGARRRPNGRGAMAAAREDRNVIFDPDLIRRIEASAARVMTATVAAHVAQAANDPARVQPFGGGALVAFGPGRYVNRAVGVSLDDLGDRQLDELETFYAASGLAPSLEVSSWAPPGLLARLAARGYSVAWFRNIYATE
jgi:MFS family permease